MTGEKDEFRYCLSYISFFTHNSFKIKTNSTKEILINFFKSSIVLFFPTSSSLAENIWWKTDRKTWKFVKKKDLAKEKPEFKTFHSLMAKWAGIGLILMINGMYCWTLKNKPVISTGKNFKNHITWPLFGWDFFQPWDFLDVPSITVQKHLIFKFWG